MATAFTSESEALTANALWTLIKPQKRTVRVYLDELIRESFTEDNVATDMEENLSRSERLAAIFKDIKRIQGQQIMKDDFIESMGKDIGLPADFDEKEAYRKYLEEKYK